MWDVFAVGDLGPEGLNGLVGPCFEQRDGTCGVGFVLVRRSVLSGGDAFDEAGFAEAQERAAWAALSLQGWVVRIEFLVASSQRWAGVIALP